MRISVIIPTHNRPNGVVAALNSVLTQTTTPHEIIIVDDGSKKDVRSILNENPPLKIIRNDAPQGACAARNKGAKFATGDILMFLDDDDTWGPKKIECQLNTFKCNPAVGLVYSGRFLVYDNNRETPFRIIKPVKRGKCYPDILFRNFIGTTSSVAVKKNIFNEVGGFDTCLPAMQDYDLWIRILKLTEIDHDNQINVWYTISKNSEKQISGNSKNHVQATKYLLEKYKIDIDKLGLWASLKIKSSRYFSIAKANRRHDYISALEWIIRSFITFPNPKVLALTLPDFIIRKHI